MGGWVAHAVDNEMPSFYIEVVGRNPAQVTSDRQLLPSTGCLQSCEKQRGIDTPSSSYCGEKGLLSCWQGDKKLLGTRQEGSPLLLSRSLARISCVFPLLSNIMLLVYFRWALLRLGVCQLITTETDCMQRSPCLTSVLKFSIPLVNLCLAW